MLTVPPSKRILLRASAVILLVLGTMPSVWLSILLRSAWPFLGGIALAFFAYCFMRGANLVLEIGPEGVSLGHKKHPRLTRWSEIVGFSLGSGIDRYKVMITSASEPAPRQVNLGLLSLECQTVRYLPDTFGVKPKELVDLLNRAKNQYSANTSQGDANGEP